MSFKYGFFVKCATSLNNRSLDSYPFTAMISLQKRPTKVQNLKPLIIIIMYIYDALINALSAHMIHINLNMIFYTHVEHSPTKTIYIKYYIKIKKKHYKHTLFPSSFSHWHAKGFSSKHIILKVDAIRQENTLFAGASMHLSARKFYRLGQ